MLKIKALTFIAGMCNNSFEVEVPEVFVSNIRPQRLYDFAAFFMTQIRNLLYYQPKNDLQLFRNIFYAKRRCFIA